MRDGAVLLLVVATVVIGLISRFAYRVWKLRHA
jgi:hypothetical protein